MNRSIKFRIWNGEKMEYNVVSGALGAFYALIDKNDTACLSPTTKYPPDTPLMQYTGCEDSTNKEIYEGDILDFTARYKQTGPVEVIYYGASFGCVITDDGGLKEFWALNHIVQQHYPEIIGNIFEHPELLK